MTVSTNPRVTEFLGAQGKLFIGGQFVDALSGKTFETPNPATGQTLATVADGQPEDIDRAVAAAKGAFGEWKAMAPSKRAQIVWRIGDLIDEHAETLAELESLDNGKPKVFAQFVDVACAAEQFRYMAGWATKVDGQTKNMQSPYTPGVKYHSYTRKEPVGVCGQIIPWNFPLLMAAWKLAPGLATGNTIVLKPAEQTPITALYLARLMQEAGVPDGVVNVVNGFGQAGAALAAHNDVNKVSFTGSTEVGKLIVDASKGNLKKVTLELGGKSPNIIFDDADLDAAVANAANAIFFNSGQACTAGSRLFVQAGIYDAVVEGVTEIARGIKLGPGMAADTQMGPLTSAEQYERVSGFVKAGIDAGATVTQGSDVPSGDGYFFSPTVLTNTTPDMKPVTDEIFGPVLVAEKFGSVEEAVAIANNTEYGLGAGIWTQNVSKAHLVAEQIQAGTVWVNCYNVLDPTMPFGGYKQSGWGREHGSEVLEAYTQTKSVVINL